MKTNFLAAGYTSRSLPLAAQTAVNLFFEPAPDGAAEAGMFYGAPGLLLLNTVGTGPYRGADTVDGLGFVVSGSKLYLVAANGSETLIGDVPGTGRCAVIHNETQLVVMHSAGWHVLDVATMTYGPVTDAPTTAQGCYQDGYIVFPKENGTYGWTRIADATVIDGLDFASAEAQPDPIIACFSHNRELKLFGERTVETAQTSGDADLVFTRTATTEHGCIAKHSIAATDSTFFWLGRDKDGQGAVYRAAGYDAQRISTFAIETAFASYGDLSEAWGYTYQQGGHTFYVLTVPGQATWAFDVSTGRWTQLAWRDPSTGEQKEHRAACYLFLAGQHLVGDRESGKLYRLDLDTYTDDGNPIVAERAWSVIEAGGNWIRHERLQLMAEMGVGLVSGQGSDPDALLDWSDDGCRTWSSTRALRLGRVGEYRNRAETRRLGRSRARTYRIRISDPVRRAFYGVNLDAKAGSR